MKPTVTVYSLSSSKDGVIRYIGQTTGRLDKRLIHHHYDSKRLSTIHKSNWIRSVVDSCYEVVISPIETNAEWGAAEIKWIKFYRDKGVDLVNTTDGGEGVIGYVRDAAWRLRRSELIKGRPSGNSGKKLSEEQRRKISEAQRGRVITPEQRAKISASLKGRKKTPEHIEKIAAANRKPVIPPTDEELAAKAARKFANLSARSKGKELSVEHRQNIASGLATAYMEGRRRGHMAKLTDDQVREIRVLLADPMTVQSYIAKRFGVSPAVISEIKSGKSYQRVK